MAAEIND